MAIFYDRICGAQKGEGNNSIYWTYLQFKNNDKLPHIHLSTNRITESLDDNSDYGQILVSGTENKSIPTQIIYSNVRFSNSSISMQGSSPIYFGTNEISYNGTLLKLLSQVGGGTIEINNNISLTGGSVSSNANGFYFKTKDGNTSILEFNKSSLNFLTNKLIVASNGDLTVPQDATIEAGSFNATSDARAKTNLIELPLAYARSFVDNTPVYTFTYKDSDTPSIGVLAQDLLKNTWFTNNFSLVNNVDATGKNGDYMSVKESKLVYIL